MQGRTYTRRRKYFNVYQTHVFSIDLYLIIERGRRRSNGFRFFYILSFDYETEFSQDNHFEKMRNWNIATQKCKCGGAELPPATRRSSSLEILKGSSGRMRMKRSKRIPRCKQTT